VMSEGNKRKMSTVGVINQRYRVVLKGNEQMLETTSASRSPPTARASSGPRPGKKATRSRPPGRANCPWRVPTPAAVPACSRSPPRICAFILTMSPSRRTESTLP
jgi:hypothetical protein